MENTGENLPARKNSFSFLFSRSFQIIAGIILLIFIFLVLNFLGVIKILNFQKYNVPFIPKTLIDTFSYNKAIAQYFTDNTLHDNMNKAYAPKKITVEQDFFLDQKTNTNKLANAFSSNWNANDVEFHSYFYFKPQTNTPLKTVIFAERKIVSPVTVDTVKSAIFSVFQKSSLQVINPFSCEIVKDGFLCNQIQLDKTKKQWFGAYNTDNTNKTMTMVSCTLYVSTNLSNPEKCVDILP